MAAGEGLDPYYRPDLALIHHLGFGFHADACAPGLLSLVEPLLDQNGLVVELGCGSGLLTRYLVEAGHRVVASDASEAMLDLARAHVRGAEQIRRLTLPDDPIPPADAVVGVGHVLNYLRDLEQVHRALAAVAGALRPGGIMAIDLCDLGWGSARRGQPPQVWRSDDWLLVTHTATPSPDRFVRDMTTFVRREDGCWRRDDEVHDNVLLDTSTVPELLAAHGVKATVASAFGDEQLPVGLVAVVGHRV